jgi:prolyl-tRNA synthetase
MHLASKFFVPMRKDVSREFIKSHRLLLRCGMVMQLGSGLFCWLPLGMRVLDKIATIVHKWHEHIGFNRCCGSIAQPAELWRTSGRYDAYGAETMRVQDRHQKELILGPTAEEVFVEMVRQNTNSAKSFPIKLYNIQWKFRDEIRPRFGIMRCREFLMCDGYSFNLDERGMYDCYNEALAGYTNMFREMGFQPIPIQQNDTGPIGGSLSHEFFALSDTAENEIEFDPAILNSSTLNNPEIINYNGKMVGNAQEVSGSSNKVIENKQETIQSQAKIKGRGTELGHIYALGQQYSEPMGLKIGDSYPHMGCYGVGVSRLVGAALEVFGTESDSECKVEWPASIAPFKVYIGGSSPEICSKLHAIDPNETYWNDRDVSFGEHRAIAGMIGAPYTIFIGDKKLGPDSIQINGKCCTFDEAVRILSE